MPSIIFIHPDGSPQPIEASVGESAMQAATRQDIDGILAECGGNAMCATCHVYVRQEYVQALPGISEDEDEMLDCTTAERTDSSRLACFVAHDERLLRHLAVHPSRWGAGLARAAMDAAVAEMRDPRLWCLADNDQAIGFYEHLGWRRTGRSQAAEYAPFPDEVEMVLPRD